MRSNEKGFGAYVGVTAFLAVALGLHTERHWSQLGVIDRGVVSLIWIALLMSAGAITVTMWKYLKAWRMKRNIRSID